MLLQIITLFMAGLAGGALNSVAGGGSFLTFPALLMTGISPITANATSTVALWPGAVASVGAYRREVGRAQHVGVLSGASLVGGGLGAVLLLSIPSATFARLIPYLLLAATLLFAFSGRLTRKLRRRDQCGAIPTRHGLARLTLMQFVIALYGGFFGGGIGILMLATLGLMGVKDIHEMNGLKTLLASLINGVAVVTFVVARAVAWPQAILMLCGAVLGGYTGAATARRLNQRLIRGMVIVVGAVMTAYFFAHG